MYFPNEIWEECLSYLTFYEMLRARRICRTVNNIVAQFEYDKTDISWMEHVKHRTDKLFTVGRKRFYELRYELRYKTIILLFEGIQLFCMRTDHSECGGCIEFDYEHFIHRKSIYNYNETVTKCTLCGSYYTINRLLLLEKDEASTTTKCKNCCPEKECNNLRSLNV